MIDKPDFSMSEIIPCLPSYFFSERGDPVPCDLVGAQIVRFGTPAENSATEGGGLVIDYRPVGAKTERRAVFAFNELGMWVAWIGSVETKSDHECVNPASD